MSERKIAPAASQEQEPVQNKEQEQGQEKKPVSQVRLIAEAMVRDQYEAELGRKATPEEFAKLADKIDERTNLINKDMQKILADSKNEANLRDADGKVISKGQYLANGTFAIYKKYENVPLHGEMPASDTTQAAEQAVEAKEKTRLSAEKDAALDEAAAEKQPGPRNRDIPTTAEAQEVAETLNQEPVRGNILRRIWDTAGAKFANMPYAISQFMQKRNQKAAERRAGETDEQHEKRKKRNKRLLALGAVAVGGAVLATKIYQARQGMEASGFSTGVDWLDNGLGFNGGSGGSKEIIAMDIAGAEGAGGNRLGNMFDGYLTAEDIFNQEGKLGAHDWMPPLEGVDAAARGESLQEGLRSSPGEFSIVLENMDLLEEGMTAAEAQARMESDIEFAREMWDKFTGAGPYFSEGRAIGANESYGSYYGAGTEQGVIMSYDDYVTNGESGVTVMHYTDKNGVGQALEFRDRCGQLIFRQPPAEVALPQGGGDAVPAEIADLVMPQGGGEVPPPETPPQGGGEVPPSGPPPSQEVPPSGPPPETPPENPPANPPTGETPPPPIEEKPEENVVVPPPPVEEQPQVDLEPKSENPADYVHIEEAPDAEAGAVEQPVQKQTEEVYHQQPGSQVSQEQVGGQAAEAVIGTGDGDRSGITAEVGTQGWTEEAAKIDLNQSIGSAIEEAVQMEGATGQDSAGTESEITTQ
ncbi:MAG: hypothetical protein Q4B06_01170 [Candidatus Saccharibacteria bacterium]|nr:hypothetical protein [Candidatus Saccharibacteria bacterium]